MRSGERAASTTLLCSIEMPSGCARSRDIVVETISEPAASAGDDVEGERRVSPAVAAAAAAANVVVGGVVDVACCAAALLAVCK